MKKSRDRATDFDTIVRENHTMIFRTILGFVHIREDAEDLTQEVFVSAWRNIGKFRGDARLSTWLYRIAVNISLNFAAQKRHKTFIQAGEDLWNSIVNKTRELQTPHRMLENKEDSEVIQKAIDSLPDKQQTAFVLTRINDLPQKEVADIMGISQRAVEQLLLRAKVNLSKKLGAGHKKK
jgi:RNA polymerase sigma-70 factor (ECF subfamily)